MAKMISMKNITASIARTINRVDEKYTSALNYDASDTGNSDSSDVIVDIKTSTVLPVDIANNSNSNGSSTTAFDAFYFYKTEQLIFLSLLFVFIVVGNCIVLLAVGLSRRRHSRMHFFILHLAIADLLVGLVTVFADLVWKIYEKWYAGDAMCKIIKFAQTFVMFASTYMLVALSIDRYDAISRPLNFTSTWTRCKVLVGLAWCLSALFSTPMLFFSAVPEGFLECWITFPEDHHWLIYFACITASVLVLPALIITACYTLIIYIIWMNSHLLAPSNPTTEKKHLVTQDNVSNGYMSKSVTGLKNSPKPHRIRSGNMGRSSKGIIPQAKIRTVKMTFTIVLVFIFCWSPYFVFNWLSLMHMIPSTQEMVAVSTFIQSLAPLNSAANPIIYGIFSTRICAYLRRLKFFRVISKLFCCNDTPKSSGVSEFSNVTDTEYTRRSPRFTDRTDFTRRSPRLMTETSDNTVARTGRPLTSLSTNNMEMCHLILISVPRSQKFS